MEGKKRRGLRRIKKKKNIFTSRHSRSLSPRGAVSGGWALLLTAFMAAGCEWSRGDRGSSSRL